MVRFATLSFVAVLGLAPAAVAAPPTPAETSRVYPLADLPVFRVGNEFDPSLLIAYLKQSVDAESWRDGTGQIAVYEQNLSLVVQQTQANHAQIVQALKRLRSPDDN